MNNLIPFDLEAAKRGEPICYGDGEPAKLLLHVEDAYSPMRVIVLTKDGSIEHHDEDGIHYNSRGKENCLFMEPPVPKPFDLFLNVYPDSRDRLPSKDLQVCKDSAGKDATSVCKITVLNGEAVSVETVHRYE